MKILIIVLLIGCSEEDENIQQITPPEQEQGSEGSGNSELLKFDLPGLQSLNYSNFKINTAEGEFSVNSNGEIENLTASESINFNIVEINEDISFAYYPELISNNSITYDNILTFYFLHFAWISIYGETPEAIFNLNKNNPYLSNTKELFENSILNNQDPFENSNFIDSFKKASKWVANQIDPNFATRASIGEFNYEKARSGEIIINNQSPLLSYLGVSINGPQGYITDPNLAYILKPSLPKAIKDLANNLSLDFMLLENGSKTFSLINGGYYAINTSNGRAYDRSFDENIKFYNKNLLTLYNYHFSTTLSPSLFSGCAVDLTKIITDEGDALYNNNEEPTTDGYIKQFRNTIANIASAIKDCSSNPKFWQKLAKKLSQMLNIYSDIEDLLEWTTIDATIRFSVIENTEDQYFNYHSPLTMHGPLKAEILSDDKFELNTDEKVKYELKVEEKIFGYNKGRNNGNGQRLIQINEWTNATQIPFELVLKSGDASINQTNPILTNNLGILEIEITAGNEDSTIELVPLIGSEDIDAHNIEIHVPKEEEENNFYLEGRWELCLFEQIIYSDSCTGDSFENGNCGGRNYEILDEENIRELNRTGTDNSCTYSYSENNFSFRCIEGAYEMSFEGTIISGNLIQGEYKYNVNTIDGCFLGNRAELRKY